MKTRPVVANTPLQISRPGFAVFSILLVIAFVFATFGDTGSALAANDYAYVYKVKNKSFEKDSDFNGIPNAWFTINFIPGMKRSGRIVMSMLLRRHAMILIKHPTQRQRSSIGLCAAMLCWL